MQISSLQLENFKNYSSVNLEFNSKVICFTGPNGAGKTNMLDAIHYLSMTRSYFQRIDRYAVREGEKGFLIDASLSNNGENQTGTVEYDKTTGKKVSINDSPLSRLSNHIGRWPCTFIAPDDKQLLYEGSRARRRFMDMTLSQMDSHYLKELKQYKKILRQRNKTLKDMAEKGKWDIVMIKSLENQFNEPAAYLYEKREEFTEKLTTRFSDLYKRISGDKEEMLCTYKSHLEGTTMAALLEEYREKDKVLERTSKGLHKDDLKVTMNGKKAKVYGSQGQLKTFVIALKLAQFYILKEECGVTPFVLLDDLFEKMDAQRLKAVVKLVHDISEGQIFITDTDPERLQNLLSNVDASIEMYSLEENQFQEFSKLP